MSTWKCFSEIGAFGPSFMPSRTPELAEAPKKLSAKIVYQKVL
jgi:hypothetical protein